MNIYALAIVLLLVGLISVVLARKLKRIARKRQPRFRSTVFADGAKVCVIGRNIDAQSILWEEPNRRNTPLLHIASRGARYSTLTGVCWLDEFRFVVNHQSGLRVALFDKRAGDEPIAVAPIPHLTDDIAAKKLDEHTWEVAMSGCWDCDCVIYHLIMDDPPRFELVSVRPQSIRAFSHGVSYGPDGELCLAFSTGEKPRIDLGGKELLLPKPWGARSVCFDPATGLLYAVAVSNTPKRSAYSNTATSLWRISLNSGDKECLGVMENVHSDSCQLHRGRLWFSDQLGDRILGFDLARRAIEFVVKGGAIDFPHGLSLSDSGVLAVTSYGSSSIILVDLDALNAAAAC